MILKFSSTVIDITIFVIEVRWWIVSAVVALLYTSNERKVLTNMSTKALPNYLCASDAKSADCNNFLVCKEVLKYEYIKKAVESLREAESDITFPNSP